MPILFRTALLIALLTQGISACSGGGNGNGDEDTSTDADTDSDGDTDADGDSDADTDSDTDSSTESFVWIVPTGSTFDDAYGSDTVQIVDTDFDISGVDLTMGGLNQDIPAPTVDCMDPTITQDCISVSGFDRTGQFFELLCIGDEGTVIGSSDAPIYDTDDNVVGWVERLGGSCDYWTEEPISFDAYVLDWDTVPAIFDETVTPGDNPPTIYVDWEFDSLDGASPPWAGTGAPYQNGPARMIGYVRHTNDYGDPDDAVMEGVFAASWNDVEPAFGVRLRGTIKGYF